MNFRRILTIAAIGASITLMGAASASAGTWANHHPRRVEVNGRLAHQNFRIDRDFHRGEINAGEARHLHREDRGIRMQERFDARFHDGHITRAEHRALNQNENGLSRQIDRDAH